MIKAGFYECDITPPYGADRPGDFAKHKIKKICDALKVRAMALCDGESKVALVGTDTIGVGPEFLRKLKEALPGINLIHSSSHTHSGGNLRDKIKGIDEAPPAVRRVVLDETISHDANYYEFCLRQAVTAVTLAFEDLQEVDFSFGSGRVENLIFNRRIRMKDGTVQTHAGKGNPASDGYAGPVDDQLGVMGVWRKNTHELLGFILNFSCHACINLEGASADFPGYAIDTVRAVFGRNSGAVYINGASGDVTQIDNLSLKKDMGRAIAVKLGQTVGGEAVKILANADRGPVETLRYLNEVYSFKLQDGVDEEEALQAYAEIENVSDTEEYRRAKRIVNKDVLFKSTGDLTAEVSVLQIGPLLIGSTPCEMFAQFALDFKAQSKFPYTWFSQLSFTRSYIPTADAFDPLTGGGYEAASAHFLPETGDELTQIICRLSSQLQPEQEPQPECVPPETHAWCYNFSLKKKK